MRGLCPATLRIDHRPVLGGAWYRLARTDDGQLCLQVVSDALSLDARNRGVDEPWEWCADVPDTMAAVLTDDENPTLVARVLRHAISAMIEGAQ